MVEENSLNIPLTEKLKGIPGIFGIRLGEGPLYTVVISEGDKEIRRYCPYILASITINGTFEEARKEPFISLASYIFGKNKGKTFVQSGWRNSVCTRRWTNDDSFLKKK